MDIKKQCEKMLNDFILIYGMPEGLFLWEDEMRNLVFEINHDLLFNHFEKYIKHFNKPD